VYEASQQGRIDRLERDRLLLKYKQQLDSLNQKIQQIQPAADYIEIAEMRNSLAKVIEDRISALDQKLQQLSKSGATFDIALDSQVQKIIAETTKVQAAAPVEQKQKSDEKTIEQLQNEIVQALERLEQVEIDKD
jgi:DNA repair exonuclease SbcCD ATPase subunit